VVWDSQQVPATLVDISETGFGLELPVPLPVGTAVQVCGELVSGISRRQIDSQAIVRWCAASPNGGYLVGVLLKSESPPAAIRTDIDYYEVLQLACTADADTVHRIYRVLALRFHPDNPETGDAEWFATITKAYQVLNDPVRRAAYDAGRLQNQQQRWKLFDSAEAAQGVQAEVAKRNSILALLYIRRMTQPREPEMSTIELEQMLGCPREHLDFAIWFLREKKLVQRSDNTRLSITAEGVEHADASGEWAARMTNRNMLPAPAPPDALALRR
jgi:DnaJ-domain-containing protein 1